MRGLLALLVALALVAGAARSDGSPLQQGARNLEETGYRADYLAFAELLVRYRQGEDAVLDDLRAAGLRFAERHGRGDAPRVVERYAQLSSAERMQGWRDYQRFAQLWTRIAEADRTDWSEERAAVLDALRALAADAGTRADPGPAGRALSLCARIAVHELESDRQLSPRAVAALAASAERDARAALAIFERAEQRTPRLEPVWLLARLDGLAGRMRSSEDGMERLLIEARALRAGDYREHALVDLARIARARGDAPRVDRLLQELASFRSPESCWALAHEHALRLIAQDAPAMALEFLDRNAPSNADERASWRELLGFAHLRAGNLDEARAALDGGDDDGPYTGAALTDVGARLTRAALAQRAGDHQRARLELADLERNGALGSWQAVFAGALRGELLLADGRPEDAYESLRAAIDGAGEYEARLDALRLLDDSGASVVGERLGLHTIALAARALCETGRALEAAATIEAHQSRALRPAHMDAATVQRWSASFEHGLVTFVCGADEARAIWIGPAGEAESLRIPRSRRALADAVRRLREAAIADDTAQVERLGEELARELLPATLRTRLASGDSDGRLLFLLHGPLERLPLELTWIEGAPLDERCASLALPGLPGAMPDLPGGGPGLPRAALEGWRVLGDPLDVDGAPRLPAARAELEQVAALHAGSTLEAGRAFGRAALVDALESGRPLHVATHLVRSADCGGARLAALALELDGGATLCANEVLALAPAAPLVVLAACETAEGRFLDAEGLQGVARAFLESGTRNLLVTLWPVEDEAARRASVRFHEALNEGLSPSRAARAARRSLRAAGAPAADWAAYRLLGRD